MRHRKTPFKLLVGHSKGALQIGNALLSLPAERTKGLRVVTLGCPIAHNDEGVDYFQYLGLFDALGQLNAWGHSPTTWTETWHGTNPQLPPAMDAGQLAAGSDTDPPLPPKGGAIRKAVSASQAPGARSRPSKRAASA